MFRAIQDHLPTDIAIFAAAVADYKVDKKQKDKIKKRKIL